MLKYLFIAYKILLSGAYNDCAKLQFFLVIMFRSMLNRFIAF